MAKKAAKPDLRVVVDNSSERSGNGESADAAADKAAGSPEQVEMPFAIVNGEAITQLPKDLYIPPQALEVFLEAFEGPLDLLLYMIRRQNLDILDIPIADITRQYMEYIGLMADMQLELAGEYLVMAATLAEIKSRMLLPRATDPNAGEEGDPRADLVRRLQEYERFKTPRRASTACRAWTATPGSPPPSSASASPRARCRRSPCRKCCWLSATWCTARKCSPTTTCSASGCRCACACLIFSRRSNGRASWSS
jgi:hypothetical protein